MTSLPRKFFSSITSAYKKINPSTLNGAIDIIVVKQEDGTLRCTPFHVRFGKLGVLQSQQTKVYITINDVFVEDLYMQLGEAGEAAFVEENLNTSMLQPIRHLEPSDSNTFLDPDNALSLSSEINGRPQLTNLDCSPQQLDQQKTPEDPIYSCVQNGQSLTDADFPKATNNSSVRRRFKRRHVNRLDQINKPMSEDDDQDTFNYSLSKRRSRVRKRDSMSMTCQSNRVSTCHSTAEERFRTSVQLLRKRSASETDLPLGYEEFETITRFHSIDSRPKTLLISPSNENLLDRTLSNPILIDSNGDSAKKIDEVNALLSKSAPLGTHPIANNLPLSPSQESQGDFFSNGDFSPNSSYESALSLRPTSPKSDTEYELDKSAQQKNNGGWYWNWGEFPEQRPSIFGYFWRSSKKAAPKEGMYLDDITSNENIDRSLYLPQFDHQRNPGRTTTNDDDQESGTGHSIPQSPFREHEAPNLLGDAQLSLCGMNPKQSALTDEIFNAHLVSYETFTSNPQIVQDPNLVVRIDGKFYTWSVGLALLVSTYIFHKPLPQESLEKLQEKTMPASKPRSTSSSSGWWLFSGKKSDMKTDTTKVTTPTEVPTVAVKSDVVPSGSSQPKDGKNSKLENDSEQEDGEVRKLTLKMEKEKPKEKEQPRISTASHQSTMIRKRMVLSSDELKRLNLKLGQNKIEFSVTNAWQGTTMIHSNIFLLDHMTKFVISDIDGTITRSDILGHIIPLVGGDWSHDGIAEFYNAIQENGYQFIYLSARAIGQSQITRNFLSNVKQSDRKLPVGPLLISPDTLMTALYREVIAKRPEEFKIECLKNIASLFPDINPFYAGFGNRINDQWAYTAVGIPVTRIYTINPSGEVVRQKLSQALSTSYRNLHEIVDLLFPPMDSFSASETYSGYTYWREETHGNAFEDEINAELEEIRKRQKPGKLTTKNKTITNNTSVLATTTPTTTVIKPSGEKLLTFAQATENTVKRA